MSWALQGYEIPIPDGFTTDYFNIERKERTASGNLVKDVIAIKKRFSLIYNTLSGEEAQLFRSLRENMSFLLFSYFQNGQYKTTTVDFSSFPSQLYLQEPEYYTSITIALEEV